MSMNRREFLATLGGSGLFFALRFAHAGGGQTGTPGDMPAEGDGFVCQADYRDIDYRDWIAFGPDNKVSVFTGRTEMGQGLKTVITAVVIQGLRINREDLTVVQGDTDCCPDDGPTNGSGATRQVGWGFWVACLKIRSNLVARASQVLGIPPANLEYRSGGVGLKGEKRISISAYDLGRGESVVLNIDPTKIPERDGDQYIDLKIPNVNGEGIVTGRMKYVGDLQMPGLLYAGWLAQPYHPQLTRLTSANLDKARALPGVRAVQVVYGRVGVIGERYSDVLKALALVKAEWVFPKRSQELRLEEARAGAELEVVPEDQGDVDAGLAAGSLVLSETYTTQYIDHAAMETDTAVATPTDANGRVTVHISSQWPHWARKMVAEHLKIAESDVHIITMPAGGAFGGKIGNAVNREAAMFAEIANAPVKLLYSRKDQFRLHPIFKAACIIDITSGVDADGRITARKIDCYQDVADGAINTYAIPHARTRAFRAPWPFGRASTRGTSFVQTCFAIESHVDMLAHRLGIDPFEFRRRNVQHPAYVNLIDACARMIGHGSRQLSADEGIGLAIVMHGGAQLGAIAARVSVDRGSGKVKVHHICVAFDIGPVLSSNTAVACIRGGVAWGIGFALSEEIMLDGHRTYTEYFSQFKIARFSDMPAIDIEFFDNHHVGSVRGCGEMPVIPTIGAIANAIYNAIGIRFYSTPITPEKIKAALG